MVDLDAIRQRHQVAAAGICAAAWAEHVRRDEDGERQPAGEAPFATMRSAADAALVLLAEVDRLTRELAKGRAAYDALCREVAAYRCAGTCMPAGGAA